MFTLKKFFAFFFLINVLLLAVCIIYVLRYHIRSCDGVKNTGHEDNRENQNSGNGNQLVTKKIRSFEEFLNENGLTDEVAILDYCARNPCLRKCCPLGQYLLNNKCVRAKAGEKYKLLKFQDIPFTNKDYNCVASKLSLEQMFIKNPCEKNYYISDFVIQESGMFKEEPGPDTLDNYHNVLEYCLDSSINGTSKTIIAQICFPPGKNTRVFEKYYNYAIGTSIIFCILTLVAYAAIPDLRDDNKHSLYGHCLMTHIFMLTIALSSWMIVDIQKFPSSIYCLLIGLVFYYSFIAAFLWMNVMCYDLWWGIRLSRPLRVGSQLNDLTNKQKYVLYCIYANGTALLFTIIVYVMNQYLYEFDRFKPDIGNIKKTCFINNRDALKVYFYYPLGVILFVNTLLFVDTICRIKRVTNNQSLRGNESKNLDQIAKDRKKEYKKVILYTKLFILMGLTWAMEIISFIFADDISSYWWLPTDIFNSLRGVFIFLIFVVKKKRLRSSKKKLLSWFSFLSTKTISLFSSQFFKNLSLRRRRKVHEQSESCRHETTRDSIYKTEENITEIEETVLSFKN